MRSIETLYKGYRFRSRLEARWAVFFDALGIEYQYEPEGFVLDGAGLYLPDFYLPRLSCWIEIKAQNPTHEERLKCAALSDYRKEAVAIFVGVPGVVWSGRYFNEPGFNVEMFAGKSTDRWETDLYDFPFEEYCYDCLYLHLNRIAPGKQWSPRPDLAEWSDQIETNRQYYIEKNGIDPCAYGRRESGLAIEAARGRMRFWHASPPTDTASVAISAYTQARSARFEHGETPNA